jgi:hypothetical protein
MDTMVAAAEPKTLRANDPFAGGRGRRPLSPPMECPYSVKRFVIAQLFLCLDHHLHDDFHFDGEEITQVAPLLTINMQKTGHNENPLVN